MHKVSALLVATLLLLWLETPSAAPELPPESSCSFDALLGVAVSVPGCTETFISGSGNEKCCKLVDNFFGLDSTEPTGNCFCVDGVVDLVKSSGVTQISTLLNSCNVQYGTKIGYTGDGEGFCPGAPPGVPAVVDLVDYDQRTFSQWVKDLKDEPILYWTAIMAIPGAIGSLAFVMAGVVSIL